MAFSATKYNKVKIFDIDTSDFVDYISPETLYLDLSEQNDNPEEITVPIYGIYINTKSMYGNAPVLALEDKFLNLPAFMLDTCNEMLQDKEAIAAINAGKVGIQVYKYDNKKYKKDCYSVKWADI